MRSGTESDHLRDEWTESLARAVGTLWAGRVVRPPVELNDLFDDAMRVHMLDVAPRPEMVNAMERAWWATEDRWMLQWTDTANCRNAYERWSDAFSVAHDRLVRWLSATQDGRSDHGAADGPVS